MAQNYFTDGAAYERRMARWSRAVAEIFLDWVAPPRGARWLEVGCGTGVLAELVVETRAPAIVAAVDPATAQIEVARNKPVGKQVDFRVADAQALPFEDRSFDLVVSSLAINFIPDRRRALAEMRRVGRPGGMVAGYVWDVMAERSPNSPIRSGLRQIGVEPPAAPGAEDTRLEALTVLFARAGLKDIATRTIDVTVSFADFDECWRSMNPGFNPISKAVAALSGPDRERLIGKVRARLPAGPGGSISYSALANAIKARVPE